MPNCNKCNTHFPNRAVIDGQERNLSKRKYCLDCSAFGKHNTRNLDYQSIKGARTCACGTQYEGKGKRCHSCKKNEQRHARKKRAIEYKGGKCQCGYKKCLGALHFHHTDPSKKDFSIGGTHCRSWDKIKAELDKCVLICSNCHAEQHCTNPHCGIHF